MRVLVDSSVWIDYFRSGENSTHMDYLLEENLLVTNDVVLAELVPYLSIKRHSKLITLLREVECLQTEINWQGIIENQVKCLKCGANGIGIPDLIIAQNAQQTDCEIYSIDKHFQLMKQALNLKLYQSVN